MKLFAIGILLLVPVVALSSTIVQTKQMALPAEGISELRVHCGAGSLYIVKAEWQNAIRVFADIEVDNLRPGDAQGFAEKNAVLSLERQARRAILKSHLKRSFQLPQDARINLTIELPGNINVFVDDGSGSVHIQHFSGDLEIKDDSGRIILEQVVGNVKVADGSGRIIIEDVRGKVEIRDGSGGIDVSRVKGDVRVTDGSGPVSIQYVDGNVTLTDGSGAIDINDVTGNVLIREPGTGEMNIERIKGTVRTQNQIEDTSPDTDAE
jgi:hypothetical protein